MRIIVCIKQVPDTTEVKTDAETGTLMREGVAATINPFDMFALEAALALKEEQGAEVTALSMGPPKAEHMLRFALALGCDEAVLLSDRAFAGADTLATSYSLASGIRKLGQYDLILTGVKTTDGDTGQVGAEIAEFLGITPVYYVTDIIKLEQRSGKIEVERELDDRSQTLELSLPCLLSVSKGINTPRLPTMESMLQASQAGIRVYSAADLGVDASRIGLQGSPTQVKKVFPPDSRTQGIKTYAGPAAVARQLADYLRDQKII